MILRIYEFRLAVLASLFVNGTVFLLVNQDIVLVLSFLEMCFIGLVYNRKHEQMGLLDAVYWISITLPFLLFLIFSSLNFDKEVRNKVFENSKSTEDYINSQISKWSSSDIRSLKLKSLVQIRHLENLIMGEALSSSVNIQLLDNDKVYASNISTDKNSLLDRIQKGKSEKILDNF